MDIVQHLDNWLTSEKTEVDPSLVAYLLLYTTKNVTGLIDILGHLELFLNKHSNTRRDNCIDLLAQLVAPSQSTLDTQTINSIVRFLDNVLDPVNSNSTKCVDILNVLMNADSIDSQGVLNLCNVLFTKIRAQKLPQQARYKVFSLLLKATNQYANDLQSSKFNFVEEYITQMDGEKDPRNLLLAFELVRIIIDKFDISSHIEDLFDVVFCYFPISFTAPPQSDNLGITTSDLKDSLRRCLAATPYFAYYATPLLIEKLLSTAGSAKKDVMETISLCTPSYGAHAILPHVKELFEALTAEIFKNADQAIVDVSLQTIHNVVATLGTGISIANIRDPVEKSIDSLLDLCLEKLKEPELKDAKPASYILRAAASASDPASTSISHAVIPLIYNQFKLTDPSFRQIAILDILIELLVASKTLYGSVEDSGYDRDFQTPLLSYKQNIFQMVIMALVESNPLDLSLKESSLVAVREMVLMKHFLKKDELDIVVSHLTHQLMHQDTKLLSLSLSILETITKIYPESIEKHTLPVLIKEVSNTTTSSISSPSPFDIIKVLCSYPVNFKVIITPYLEVLNQALLKNNAHTINNNAYQIASTLLNIYSNAVKDCVILEYAQEILIPKIIRQCFNSIYKQKDSWILDDRIVEVFSMMIATTIRLSTSSIQGQFLTSISNYFINGEIPDTIPNTSSSNSVTLSIFEPYYENEDDVDITIFFTAVIGNCKKDVKLPATDSSLFLSDMTKAALETPLATKRLALAKIIASIMNKWTNEISVPCIKKITDEYLIPIINNGNLTNKKSALIILIWIIKALVTKGHAFGFGLLEYLLSQCGTKDLGNDAAEGFNIILSQDELILNKASHSTVSLLYKQRVFNSCFIDLIHETEGFNILEPGVKINYLFALIYLLKNVPNQIRIAELPRLMQPIIAALSSQDANLVIPTLSISQETIPHSQETVIHHLGSFIHALLRLTRFRNMVNVRISALECLGSLVINGKSETLSPFQPSVIKELAPALDDKKRIVRKHAVSCREKWYTIRK